MVDFFLVTMPWTQLIPKMRVNTAVTKNRSGVHCVKGILIKSKTWLVTSTGMLYRCSRFGASIEDLTRQRSGLKIAFNLRGEPVLIIFMYLIIGFSIRTFQMIFFLRFCFTHVSIICVIITWRKVRYPIAASLTFLFICLSINWRQNHAYRRPIYCLPRPKISPTYLWLW